MSTIFEILIFGSGGVFEMESGFFDFPVFLPLGGAGPLGEGPQAQENSKSYFLKTAFDSQEIVQRSQSYESFMPFLIRLDALGVKSSHSSVRASAH